MRCDVCGVEGVELRMATAPSPARSSKRKGKGKGRGSARGAAPGPDPKAEVVQVEVLHCPTCECSYLTAESMERLERLAPNARSGLRKRR